MDATVAAVPVYFGTMEAERRYLARRAEREGPSAADYERRDTITSLTMGVASLVAPIVMPKVLGPFTPGQGRYGKALVAGALGAVAVTVAADRIARRVGAEPAGAEPPGNRARRRRIAQRGAEGRVDRWRRVRRRGRDCDHDDVGVARLARADVEPPRRT